MSKFKHFAGIDVSKEKFDEEVAKLILKADDNENQNNGEKIKIRVNKDGEDITNIIDWTRATFLPLNEFEKIIEKREEIARQNETDEESTDDIEEERFLAKETGNASE